MPKAGNLTFFVNFAPVETRRRKRHARDAPFGIRAACGRRGRRLMHDGMQYDPNQGQGHQPLKVGNLTIFKG